MSRRQLSLLVLVIASFVVTACGVGSSTAPHSGDTTAIVTNGGGG